MTKRSIAAHANFGLLFCALVFAPSVRSESRGELLYSTHCIACHTTQIHWRERKLAVDWTSLKAQVQNWQGAAVLTWTDDDVMDVTRYLNLAFYHFGQTPDPLAMQRPHPAQQSFTVHGLGAQAM